MGMSDMEYYILMMFAVGLIAAVYTYAFLEGFGEKTKDFTFFYVELMDGDILEYYVMTLEHGEVYFRGNITDPKGGKTYRITYTRDHSVKVRRYVVKKCEAVE